MHYRISQYLKDVIRFNNDIEAELLAERQLLGREVRKKSHNHGFFYEDFFQHLA